MSTSTSVSDGARFLLFLGFKYEGHELDSVHNTLEEAKAAIPPLYNEPNSLYWFIQKLDTTDNSFVMVECS